MLILAGGMAVLAIMPALPLLITDFRDGTIPLVMTVFFTVFGALSFLFVSSVIIYVISPVLSYVVQLITYIFGPLPRRKNSIRIDYEGLHKTSNGQASDFAWNKVHAVVDTRSSILIFTNRNCAVMIPKSAFATHDAADAFAQKALEYWTDAKSVF